MMMEMNLQILCLVEVTTIPFGIGIISSKVFSYLLKKVKILLKISNQIQKRIKIESKTLNTIILIPKIFI